ncbi:DNA polymerase I [Shimazuella sp. AN120528]|uniref:DNA polymerase I n=1 Tax=Shimazuella soli TaxID=1892854 RepID=UPI001F0E4247|nr:DNA polymerase I [Shimazuella soli]MCH5584380.1 DNA polymerase I [Shimazuella soli]
MKKLMLIDGNSILYRAFFALPLLSNSSGIHTNAAYGFAMMLVKMLEEEKPTHVLVAFDAGKMTFRHKDYEAYKGKRDKTPGELSEQVPLVQEILDAFAIQTYQQNGFEADDIIGTLAVQAEKEKINTLIVSGDKDLFQLIADHVTVLHTKKGVTEIDRYDEAALHERYGLRPDQIVDLKGLMGDPSDNIPGIPGVGEKTALKLLAKYPTVEEIIAHPEAYSGKKLQEKLREFADDAVLSKKLATIHTEVPLPFSFAELKLQDFQRDKVRDVFSRLEFRTLMDRVDKSPLFVSDEEGEMEITTAAHDYVQIEESNKEEWAHLFQQSPLAVHLETDVDNPHRAIITGIGLSSPDENVFLPLKVAKDWDAFRIWVEDKEKQKVVYDLKRSKILLEREQIPIHGFVFDVLLAAYVLNPSETKLELSDLALQQSVGYLPSDEEAYGKGAKRKPLTGDALASHVTKKTAKLFALYDTLQKQLEENDLTKLLCELEMPLAAVLADMEEFGVKVDKTQLEELGFTFKEKIDQLEKEIIELAGTAFNINSPKQLSEILFEKLGLPVIKKTKTGYSTGADVLEKLAPQHEIVEKILHYRQVGKLYSTYIEGLKKEIASDGKIHTRFNQTIAATGRLSSTEPNLQNIPIRLEEGRQIRQVFVPSEENWVILAADYSQVELRILAHLSEDPILQRAFQEDRDIHTQTAMDVFDVDTTEVSSLMRSKAKAVNFGIVYGISAFGLSQNINIPQKEAKEFIERYFATYPNVRKFMDEVVIEARKTGYVTTLLNRRRYLPDINASQFNARSFAERTAMNTPIQGSAADIIKNAMVHLYRAMQERQLKSRMLLQVHDELIFEVPPEELEEMKKLVREEMENAVPLSVPLKVDVNIGKSWYEAK